MACEAKYPEPHPEWLRFLINDKRREDMALHRQRMIEVPLERDIPSSLPSRAGWGAAIEELDSMGLGSDDNPDYWEALAYEPA